MAYQTVFDISTAGYKNWDFPTFGLLFIAVGAVLVANRRSLPGWWRKHRKASSAFAFFFLGFAVLWTLVAFASTYGQYRSLTRGLGSSSARTVEGVVTNFTPMPASGHSMEKFCVSATCFEYSNYVVVGGFNNIASHGGPIRNGLPVRITYVGNSILKLEIVK